MKILVLLLSLFMMKAYADFPVDYQYCSDEQVKVINMVQEFHLKKSKYLLSQAAKVTGKDKHSLAMKKHLVKLAQESFIKNMALEKVSESFASNSQMATSISDFKSAFDESMKTKLVVSDAVDGLNEWISSSGSNSRAFNSLSSNLKDELIERAFMTFGNKIIGQLSDEESYILGITSEIGLNAAFYYGGRLVTSQAVGKFTASRLVGWAGGPAGIVMMVAPLFMSGTLPPETKWTDLTRSGHLRQSLYDEWRKPI